MISNFRVLSKELLGQTLSCLTGEVLQQWTESSRIPASRKMSVWRKQKAPKRRPLLPRMTDRLLDLRMLLGHWGQWFSRELCGPIYSWSSKWWCSGIRFEIGRNSIINDANPIWWHLGKLVQTKNTRVWETQDRIGIVRPGDSSEESKTWLSQTEDNGEMKYRENFYEWRILRPETENCETSAVVKNQGTQQRGQRILGECWQWEANGQCSNGDTCSFRHDINKRATVTQSNTSSSSFMRQNERNASRTRSPRGKSQSGRMFRLPCKDYLKGTCTNSFCKKWHPPECLFYKSEKRCRFGEKCSYAHR